jgi:predicted DNA-binding protein
MPSIPVYIREANYQKLRRASEKTGKTIGQIINELIENNLQNTAEALQIPTHKHSTWRRHGDVATS